MYRELIIELSQGNAFVKIQPPCPEREIDDAEKAVGYPFPKELRNLLRELNGDQWLLLSAQEIIEDSKRNREIQNEYRNEALTKDFDPCICFAANGCGDFYCYQAGSDGMVNETAIYIWEHETLSCRQIATDMTDLITRYYKSEI